MQAVTKSMPTLLCITGTDGSGKSTLLGHLRGFIASELGKDVRCVSLWDQVTSGSRAGAFRSRDEVKTYVGRLSSLGRFLFVLHLWAESLGIAAEEHADVLLLDAYWYKYAATEIALGCDKGRILAAASIFPVPTATWHLQVDPQLAASRKSHFGAYECGYSGACVSASFVIFQRKIRAELDGLLSQQGRMYPLDGSRSILSLCGDVLQDVRPLIERTSEDPR
jgi:dTMP kinase